MTLWFVALAPSASQCHRSSNTCGTFTLRERCFIAGARAARSMLAAVRKNSALLIVSRLFCPSRMFSLMTRTRLCGRVASWSIRRVAVASHSTITDASWSPEFDAFRYWSSLIGKGSVNSIVIFPVSNLRKQHPPSPEGHKQVPHNHIPISWFHFPPQPVVLR